MDGSDKSPVKSDDEDAAGFSLAAKMSSASISLSEFEKKNFK